jgi:hypothetical protein
MNSVQNALMQARTEELRSAVRAQTAESVLADLFLIYKAAETEPVEEIRDGLGQLVDKLQRTRSAALEQGARVAQLAEDLQVRLRAEETAE